MTELEEYGYVIIPKSVEEDVIDKAMESINEWRRFNPAASGPDGYVRRVSCLHNWHTNIRRLFTRNWAEPLMNDFFGEKTVVYTSLYFEAGSQQSIHRDTPYFHTNPVNKFLGVWVAMEDADETNGALKVVPGGHLVPEEDLQAIDQNPETRVGDYQKLMMASCMAAGLPVKTLLAKKGDTIIWHPMLPHGGGKIFDPTRTRNSMVFHVTPRDVPVGQPDAFFNPVNEQQSSWTYYSDEGADFVDWGGKVFWE